MDVIDNEVKETYLRTVYMYAVSEERNLLHFILKWKTWIIN